MSRLFPGSGDYIIAMFLGSLPILTVLLVGAGLCLRHATRQPKRAVITSCALAVTAGNMLLSSSAGAWLQSVVVNFGGSQEMQILVIRLWFSSLSSLSLALLLWAVFGGGTTVVVDSEDDEA